MGGDLCDNIGLVLVYLPSGSTDIAALPSQYYVATAIRDPYLVSCTFYACWRSLYSPFLEFLIDLAVVVKCDGITSALSVTKSVLTHDYLWV